MHFSLLHLVFKDPVHHLPNQTEIATEEFCPKSLLRKQNVIDFIVSHFQAYCNMFNKIKNKYISELLNSVKEVQNKSTWDIVSRNE